MTAVACGRWPSPLDATSAAGVRLHRSGLASDGTFLYWLESLPDEGGRVAVFRARPGSPPDQVSPPGANVRSRVHEYGGGAFCLVPSAGPGATSPRLAYVELGDQRVRVLAPGSPAMPIGPEAPATERWHLGDLRAMPDGRHILAVRERLREGSVSRTIVCLEAEASAGAGTVAAMTVVVEGSDFLVAPRPDPTGRRLAWVSWDHPHMSWTSSELWVGDLGERQGVLRVTSPRRVAGGPGISVGQPVWSSDGALWFASDAGGWWRPWRWRPGTGAVALSEEQAEYHSPDWALGQSTMVPLGDGGLVCRRREDGLDSLVWLHPPRRSAVIGQPAVSIGAVCPHGPGLAWMGSTPFASTAIWWLEDLGDPGDLRDPGDPADLEARVGGWSPTGPSDATGVAGTATGATTWPVRLAVAPAPAPVRPEDVSVGQPFTFSNRQGSEVHGLFYPPCLAGVSGLPGERPPLVVQCHGGPTGSVDAGFDVVVQFLTTRGFAVAAVDYGGSTGYGRAYRERLAGRWGVLDVDDCVDAATHLSHEGRVDPSRLAIRGSSAGGFTALGALIRSQRFRAAVSWYGVTDLQALAASTHDFEAHYNDWLVGPLPESARVCDERSPLHAVEGITGAVLLLQGLDDPVVPPQQAEAMAAALVARGVPCRLLVFPGEGHGFRRSETVARCLEAEHAFYLDVLVDRAG